MIALQREGEERRETFHQNPEKNFFELENERIGRERILETMRGIVGEKPEKPLHRPALISRSKPLRSFRPIPRTKSDLYSLLGVVRSFTSHNLVQHSIHVRDLGGARYQLEPKLQNERMLLHHSTDLLILHPRQCCRRYGYGIQPKRSILDCNNLKLIRQPRSKIESFLFIVVKLGQQDDSLGKGICSQTQPSEFVQSLGFM